MWGIRLFKIIFIILLFIECHEGVRCLHQFFLRLILFLFPNLRSHYIFICPVQCIQNVLIFQCSFYWLNWLLVIICLFVLFLMRTFPSTPTFYCFLIEVVNILKFQVSKTVLLQLSIHWRDLIFKFFIRGSLLQYFHRLVFKLVYWGIEICECFFFHFILINRLLNK